MSTFNYRQCELMVDGGEMHCGHIEEGKPCCQCGYTRKGPSRVAELEREVAELRRVLTELVDAIESAGGHDENDDVFDLTEAIALLAGAGKT